MTVNARLRNSARLQALVLLAALFSGCATTPESSAISGAMPTVNAQAAAQCTALGRWDFAFSSSADGDSELYLYRAADSSLEKLTDNVVQDHWATWSNDGRMLAFQTLRDDNREIYIKVLGSESAVNASQNVEQDLLPSWSPDGQYIVYFSSRDVPWEGEGPIGGHLYVMRVQGSVVGRIQTDPFMSTSGIAWSADSSMLFYARYGAGKAGIYAFEIGSGTETAILALEGKFPGVASMNPAAGTVDYFVEQDGYVNIYQLSLFDGSSLRLTRNPGRHYYASWSPDRSALLVTSAQDENGQLYDIRCMAADGSYDVVVIDDLSDARSAQWRPGSSE